MVRKLLSGIITVGLIMIALNITYAQAQVPAAKPSDSTQASVDLQKRPDPSEPQSPPRYLIKRDDSVVLSFPLTPEFNQTLVVQPDGYINPGGTTGVYVLGLTVPQVADAVKAAYSHVLHDPVLEVDLKDFQQPIFSVLGQVGKPGQYPLRYDTSLAEAVAVGGGLLATSKTQIFLLRRTSSDQMQVHEYKIDFTGNSKHISEAPRLQPGDIVFVPEKFITKFRKYVPYYLGFSASDATLF